MAATNAAKQRKIRQESLREWLSAKCTAQHLVDNIEKIEALDHESESFSNELAKYRTANDQRLKILDKYLPTPKQVDLELTGENGNPIEIDTVWEVQVINAKDADT